MLSGSSIFEKVKVIPTLDYSPILDDTIFQDDGHTCSDVKSIFWSFSFLYILSPVQPQTQPQISVPTTFVTIQYLSETVKSSPAMKPSLQKTIANKSDPYIVPHFWNITCDM